MDKFLNYLKVHAAGLDASMAQPRCATLASFDPNTYTARVQIQPEGVLSGWLPVAAAWSGAGWGMLCPPTPGQQVLVIAQEGQSEHGIIVGTLFSQAMAPPSVPAGEFWLLHQSGSAIKLHSDGSIVINSGQITLTGGVQMNGNATISGNLTVTGSVTVDGSISDATGQVGSIGG